MKPSRHIALWAAGIALALPVARFAAKIASARMRSLSCDGSIVAITGGSRGLGLALAHEFGRRGARIAICARDADELERACEQLSADGIDVFGLDANVRDRSDVERFIQATVTHFGSLNVLVNNAGTIAVGPMSCMTREDYAAAMETHFWAPRDAVEAVLPIMRRQGGGRIVNVSSIGGIASVPHLLPYCASKFALTGYSLGLRAELLGENIVVTTVCPGLMQTGSPRNAIFKGQNVKEYGWFDLMDTSPLTSVSAESAARQIASAALMGEHLVVISWQAKTLALLSQLFANQVGAINAVVIRLLPSAGGQGENALPGASSESALTRSSLTQLGRDAESALNQRP